MLSRTTWSLLVAVSAATVACQDPTQIKVKVSTRGIPCGDAAGEVGSTVFLSGPSATELRDEVITERCETSPGGATIGDLTYVPRDDKTARFTVEVFLGLGDRRAETCAAACANDCVDGCEGCIRASRRMGFIPEQKLLMSVVGDVACNGVCCDGDSTCVDGGCVSNEILPCLEGDPTCGGGLGGGGGAGGGGADPELTRQVIGGYDVLAVDGARAYFIGNIDGDEHRQGFVAAANQLIAEPRPVLCSSSGGDVTMISAVPGDGRLYALGRWSGSADLQCQLDGGDVASPLAHENDEQAFVLVVPTRPNESPRMVLVGSWDTETELELTDIAVVSETQALVVGYLEGTFTAPATSDPVSGSGLLLAPLSRDQTGGLGALRANVITTTVPLKELQAVGRVGREGAVVAGRMTAGTMSIANLNGNSTMVGDDAAETVFALSARNFSTGQGALEFTGLLQLKGAANQVFLDGLGYYGHNGLPEALLAVRHGVELSGLANPELTGPGCSLVHVPIEGGAQIAYGTRFESCERMLVGRSEQGNAARLVGRLVGGFWEFNWPAVQGPETATLELTEKAGPVGMFQLDQANEYYVIGNTTAATHLDASAPLSACQAPSRDLIWGTPADTAAAPFLRCYRYAP